MAGNTTRYGTTKSTSSKGGKFSIVDRKNWLTHVEVWYVQCGVTFELQMRSCLSFPVKDEAMADVFSTCACARVCGRCGGLKVQRPTQHGVDGVGWRGNDH